MDHPPQPADARTDSNHLRSLIAELGKGRSANTERRRWTGVKTVLNWGALEIGDDGEPRCPAGIAHGLKVRGAQRSTVEDVGVVPTVGRDVDVRLGHRTGRGTEMVRPADDPRWGRAPDRRGRRVGATQLRGRSRDRRYVAHRSRQPGDTGLTMDGQRRTHRTPAVRRAKGRVGTPRAVGPTFRRPRPRSFASTWTGSLADSPTLSSSPRHARGAAERPPSPARRLEACPPAGLPGAAPARGDEPARASAPRLHSMATVRRRAHDCGPLGRLGLRSDDGGLLRQRPSERRCHCRRSGSRYAARFAAQRIRSRLRHRHSPFGSLNASAGKSG